jgi:hypothetical protein
MRVPRSGSMILQMLVALTAIFLLPIVFLGALSHSAEAHPRSMKDTVTTLARPLVGAVQHLLARGLRVW